MIVKLTDRELIALGYDEPYSRDEPNQVRSILHKGRAKLPLNDVEINRLIRDVDCLATNGTNPSDAATATRLAAKVRKAFGQ